MFDVGYKGFVYKFEGEFFLEVLEAVGDGFFLAVEEFFADSENLFLDIQGDLGLEIGFELIHLLF